MEERKETPDEVENGCYRDVEDVGHDIVEEFTTVDDVVEEEKTVEKKKVDKSVVLLAKDKFARMSVNKEETFECWKERRQKGKEHDRSANMKSNFKLNGQRMGVETVGAGGEGQKKLDGGKPLPGVRGVICSNISGQLNTRREEICAPTAVTGEPVFQDINCTQRRWNFFSLRRHCSIVVTIAFYTL